MKDWIIQVVATIAAGVVVWYLNEYQSQPLKNVENLNFTAPVTPSFNLKSDELAALVRAEEARLKEIQSQRMALEQQRQVEQARLLELQQQREAEEARLEALKQQRQVFEPEMVDIPAGSFEMGSPSNEEGRSDDEGPVHMVQVKAFQMGKYEITRGQFRAFVNSSGYKTEAETGDGCYGWTGSTWERKKEFNWRNVGFEQNDNHPVVCVSWNDSQKYIEWLNNETGKNYRLPTEAEWEYAARAGTSTRFSFGNDDSDLGNYAWFYGNSDSKTHPVGKKQPNPWGLYDMHGNVWEWNQDKWHDSYAGAPTDGSAWEAGDSDYRLLRGCSWGRKPGGCRSAYRDHYDNSSNLNGVRVVAAVSSP